MATTTTTTETKNATDAIKATRNFRTNPEVENFYRFVYENDLRFEAKKVFEQIVASMKKETKKRKRRAKAKSKKLQ